MKPCTHGRTLSALLPAPDGSPMLIKGLHEVMPQSIEGEVCRVYIRRGLMLAVSADGMTVRLRKVPAQDPNGRLFAAFGMSA